MLIIIAAALLASRTALAVLPQNLQSAISEKARQLQTINEQIQEQQKNLEETGEKGRSLKNELKRIDQNIGQLSLNIKSSELSIEKLGLETDSLQLEVERTSHKITAKKEGIDKTLKVIQQKDAETLVMIFLRNKSLAESLAETEDLGELSSALAENIRQLAEFKKELEEKLDAAADKKVKAEGERRLLRSRKAIVEEQKQERQELLVKTKNQERVYEQAIGDLEKLQTAIAEEVETLEAQLRTQIDPQGLPLERPGVLEWPVRGRQSQGYGATAFARRGGYRGRWHNGIDIAGPIGAAILSAGDGTVLNLGDQDKACRRGAYGKYAVVRHINNLTTLYGHLSRLREDLTVGTAVKRGELIGYMGNTGYSRGSHLHFTVYDSRTFGMRPSRTCGLMPSGGDLNPLSYL